MKAIKFKTAEGAVWFYLLLLEETLRYVPAIYPGEKVYLPKQIACSKCGGRGYRWSESKHKGARWICASARCGKTWPTHPVVDSVRGSRHGKPPMENFRDLFADLGRIFHQELTLWERRILFGYVWIGGAKLPIGARRVQLVAYALQRKYPRAMGGWTVYRVRQLLRSARNKIERRLELAHLMAEE